MDIGLTFTTLKKRSEFLRVRGGASWGTPAFLLQVKLREGARLSGSQGATGLEHSSEAGCCVEVLKVDKRDDFREPRFGFTVTKKMGNAVVRNRIRRRLKAAVEKIGSEMALKDCDYVLVARRAASTRIFEELLSDLSQAFVRVHAKLRDQGRKR